MPNRRASDCEGPDIESMVAIPLPYETANPGTADPVMGTEPCGFPLTPAESSASHVTDRSAAA